MAIPTHAAFQHGKLKPLPKENKKKTKSQTKFDKEEIQQETFFPKNKKEKELPAPQAGGTHHRTKAINAPETLKVTPQEGDSHSSPMVKRQEAPLRKIKNLD